MRTTFLFLFLWLSMNRAFSQNIDSLSYHTSQQLSDISYSIKKANGNSTVILFEESASNNGQNITNVPTYANQDSAINNRLVNGDLFKLPPDANGNHILAIVDATHLSNFSYVVDNTNGESSPGFQISSSDSTHFNVIVDWGDGSINHYTSFANYRCLHTYNINGTFTITITVNDIDIPDGLTIHNDWIQIDNKMTSISNISRLTNLKRLNLEWNQLPASLMDTIQLPAKLTDLALAGNSLGNYNPTNLPSSLLFLDLRNNNLSILPVNNLPASLLYVSCRSNQLITSSINDILIHFNTSGLSNGQLYIDENTPPASPTGSGITAKANLIAKGWDVGTD